MRGIAILLCVSLCGCSVNWDTLHFARVKPADSDIAGQYVLTAESTRLVRSKGKYPQMETLLVFSQDGSFEMRNMPDWWNTPFGDPKGGFDSGKGKWKTAKQEDWWGIELSFDSRKNFNSDRAESGLTFSSVPIAGQSAPYRLWFYVGDPDSGKVMIFEKSKTHKGKKTGS